MEETKTHSKTPSTKWVIKEGGCVDNTTFTNGKREISFDEWFDLYYKTK